MAQSLEDWCHTHLPCWTGPGCPRFEQFLWQTGWLLNRWDGFDWTVEDGEYVNMTTAGRCFSEDGMVAYDLFAWRYEPSLDEGQVAWFSVETGELVFISRYSLEGRRFCCDSGEADHQQWGVLPEDAVTVFCSSDDLKGDYWWIAELGTQPVDTGACTPTPPVELPALPPARAGCGCASSPGASWLVAVAVLGHVRRRAVPAGRPTSTTSA